MSTPTWVRPLAVFVAACVPLSFASAAGAVTFGVGPAQLCMNEQISEQDVIEQSLSPIDGATAQVGVPVTFSAEAYGPLTFAIASSSEALATPDIVSGAGVASGSTGAEGHPVYSFETTLTAPGTVYWQTSYSTAPLAECASFPAFVDRTAVRTLPVEPAAEPVTTGPASEEGSETGVIGKASCVVPALRGDSLTRARRLLHRAHCRLGRVTGRRKKGHGRLVVRRERPHRGTQMRRGGRVRVVVRRRRQGSAAGGVRWRALNVISAVSILA